MRECPDEKTLIAFARGELAAGADTAIEAHAEKCRRCAKALAALDVNDDLLSRLRDLEQARAEQGPMTELLQEIERRSTSTLFGQDQADPPH
jgi:anti-sigma factor RsiW